MLRFTYPPSSSTVPPLMKRSDRRRLHRHLLLLHHEFPRALCRNSSSLRPLLPPGPIRAEIWGHDFFSFCFIPSELQLPLWPQAALLLVGKAPSSRLGRGFDPRRRRLICCEVGSCPVVFMWCIDFLVVFWMLITACALSRWRNDGLSKSWAGSRRSQPSPVRRIFPEPAPRCDESAGLGCHSWILLVIPLWIFLMLWWDCVGSSYISF